MNISGVELRRVRMPLVAPFRTSFGTEYERDVLLVRVATGDGYGWGECVAMSEPVYSSEYVSGAAEVIAKFLVPLLGGPEPRTPHDVEQRFAKVKGHPMAKAALHTAILDAYLRETGTPLAEFLGGVTPTVPTGVSVGIQDSLPELLSAVEGYLAEGYARIKLKIEPGWDIEPVRAVRERFGDILLQVDANCAYELRDARHLAELDRFDLLLIEQPLAEDDLRGHAALARQLRTPMCLDESIVSARAAADAIAIGAAAIVNIKPGRVGGYLEARRIHDVCAAHGVPVWIGGMLETGVGRAANLALAALPNFTLPGDVSASRRYYEQDLTAPFELVDGLMTVPAGAGIGVDPEPEVLRELTTEVTRLTVG
ncbi:o-succinylbenzoate synthase [Hamadaea tsunoensis]|uniref:o-succinylbenzoate synthase n=1 Tax=Hamadaea tsunoensis TaxID=53368 RepID=UPI0003F7ACB8|nr:o-succinylbenzoate synthase [Hamadaea tsunoensis]